MKENFDYDYTIAVHFQSLDEMRPELAFRIGAWIGSSKYIDWEISTVGDCFLYYYKGTDEYVPGFVRKNCYVHNINYDTKRKAVTIFDEICGINNVLADK